MLTILLSIAGVAAGFLLVALVGRPVSAWLRHKEPLDTGPAEPCWTEAIASDGRYRYARSQCVHDPLMELDARAARNDFPIPKAYD